MDYMATLLGRNSHNPRRIPTSNLPSQKMNDVVAVLSDPFFFLSNAELELKKRNKESSGSKDALIQRLYEALEAEFAQGWTLGYLLNTKVSGGHGRGSDPRSLVGHHIKGYSYFGEGTIILTLSDGDDVTIQSKNQPNTGIKMDNDLFWALHTLDGMKAVPRDFAQRPLLITEAVTGMRRDRSRRVWIVFGLKLEGMRVPSFFFQSREVLERVDMVCGDVWMEKDDVPRQDSRMLQGSDETLIEDGRERRTTKDESVELEKDLRGLHGD